MDLIKLKQRIDLAGEYLDNPDIPLGDQEKAFPKLKTLIREYSFHLSGYYSKVKNKTEIEKIKHIEEEAYAKGWTENDLWNIPDNPKRLDHAGLIYFLREHDRIAEVTDKHIKIVNNEAVEKIHYKGKHF